MANYWKIVNMVIEKADILLLVLDARMPELTRNKEIEQKISKKGRKILYVLNKCDLVDKKKLDNLSHQIKPSVFVSVKEKQGGTILFRKIMALSRGNPCIVGVLGYPNVGKSSVINLLKGKKSASVSSQAGHTKGIQIVRAKEKIRLLDTPGVLEFKEKDLVKQVLIGAVSPQQIETPSYYAMKIVEMYPEKFSKYYQVEFQDPVQFLDDAAAYKNVLKQGGKPDIERFAVQLIMDWQKGKIT